MREHGLKKRVVVLVMACVMMCGLLSMQAAAKQGDEVYQTVAAAIAKATGTETVKTIWWKAKVTANLKATTTETGAEVKLPTGTEVTIIQRDYHKANGISQCRLANNTHCYIANQYLQITAPLATGAQGDYSKETKEAYVNGQTITSNTDTMLWISLDKQRVNVFKGSNRNWKLVKTFKASTGMADYPTLDQTFKKKYVAQKKMLVVDGLQYYTVFYGSGIHKWPGGDMAASIGKVPMSHSCVRLKGSNAKWIFSNTNVPLRSRIWIW